MNFSLLFAAVFSLPAFGFSSPPAQAPASFTHLVAFGDRFSGVGDCADAADAELGVRCPGPAFDYEDGHFTDGTTSAPVSGKYAGAWHEQPARLPGLPTASASFGGGTDYASDGAFTTAGTSRRGVGSGFWSRFLADR